MPVAANQFVRAVVLDQGTYTPVLTATTTNPILGSGTVESGGMPQQAGWWKRVDNLVMGAAFIRFGAVGASAGSGGYFISLPFPADTSIMIGSDTGAYGSVIGSGELRDNTAPTIYHVACQLRASGTGVRLYEDASSANVNDSNPMVWANNDALSITFRYQADPTAF